MSEYPKGTSARSGTDYGYSVEARLNYIEPRELCGVFLDNKWKRVDLHIAKHGIPTGYLEDVMFYNHKLVGYSAAQALRWYCHACADSYPSGEKGFCLETRLVRHKIEYKSECQAVSEHAHIGGENCSHRNSDSHDEKGDTK